MKLADLRKLAIRRQTRIRFPLRNGLECVVTEHGVAQVLQFKGIPDFNLEEELAAAAVFTLDPITTGKKNQAAPAGTSLTREELAGMTSSGTSPAEAPAHEDD